MGDVVDVGQVDDQGDGGADCQAKQELIQLSFCMGMDK